MLAAIGAGAVFLIGLYLILTAEERHGYGVRGTALFATGALMFGSGWMLFGIAGAAALIAGAVS